MGARAQGEGRGGDQVGAGLRARYRGRAGERAGGGAHLRQRHAAAGGAETLRRLRPQPAGAEGGAVRARLPGARRAGAAGRVSPVAADVAARQQPRHQLRPLPLRLPVDTGGDGDGLGAAEPDRG